MFRMVRFLFLMAVILAVGWYFRDPIVNRVEGWLSGVGSGEALAPAETAGEASPVAADEVEAALAALARGEGPEEVRIGEEALRAYFALRLAPILPEGVEQPAFEVRDSTLAFSLLLDFGRLDLSGSAAGAGAARMFGDSARVAGEILPRMGRAGEAEAHIVSLQAGVIPVPPPVLGVAAEQLGLRTEGRAVLFDIPEAIADVRIEDASVVLRRR